MLYLRDRTTLFSQRLRVLHVAPEPVLFDTLSRLDNIEYVPAGQSNALARVPMDITDIQYPDNSFDAIICVHVLEHVRDDLQAMREFRRVLKPGGWAILQVPVDNARETTYEDPTITAPIDRLRAFGQDDHVRLYGLDYAERLTDAGFSVSVEDYTGRLGKQLTQRFGLAADEKIYLCLSSNQHEP